MPNQDLRAEVDLGKASTRGERRILVVDDDAAVRSSMVEVLRTQAFSVDEAADGAAATWKIAAGEFDVLVLDLHLSHLDGTAVLEALEAPATVVIVSAFSHFDEQAIRDTFATKLFACLRKPVAPEHLIEVVSAAAAAASAAGRAPQVRPIEPGDALRLGLAGLASLGPQRR